ncbi:MAG: 23S rRNA (adenine(2503)-C(2))-methyltransferase RlmN [Planctomycetota bacterium]
MADAADPRPHVFDLTPDELSAWLVEHGLAKFRAAQVLDWVYRKGIVDPQAMTNLAAADRDRLAGLLRFTAGDVVREQLASDGTRKLLIDWSSRPPLEQDNAALPVLPDDDSAYAGDRTECVMIPADRGRRRTACISSQVGCPVGCRFCASGLGGLDRNLTAGQIVEQAWRLAWMPDPTHPDRQPTGLSNIVFMGMGEPLSNYPAVIRAITALTADWGLNLSARKVTLSTVGLPAQMRRLADAGLPPITLAVSLHAPNDELRREIIPWAERVSIDQLVDAGRYYFDRTGREVTLEYILLGNLNDQPSHARELATVAKRLRSNVNLIRYNEVAGLPYARPDDDDVHRFQRVLRDRGVNAHLRASRGRDIAAACGQLRHEAAQQPQPTASPASPASA